MADKDTLNLIKFKFGSFQSIKDLSSKEQSSFYFADDKPTFYNAGLWYGVSSLTSSVNEETGEVTLTINGDLGEDWKGSQPVCTFVAGMTTQQKADLEKAVGFVKTFEDPNIDNTKDVIDKWNEIISFLEGFKDTDVLLDRIVTLETNVTNLQNTTINAGDGLKGGGNLTGNRTIALGTPSTITDSSTNSVTTDSHTHAIDEASTEQRGIVRLNDSLTSTSTDQALTAKQGNVLDGKVNSITDLVNDMFEKITENGKTYIKTKYGFASDKFVSAGGTDDTESGGGGGANLSQMWESLQGNSDTFANTKINKAHIPTLDVDHIPTLTTGKISDFVSATQAIADNAVANKADKATTLSGYGITDAVDLTSAQIISGAKTFRQAIIRAKNPSPLTLDNTDPNYTEIGVRFTLEGVSKAWVGYTEDTGVYFYTYNAPHRLGLKDDGTAYVDNNTIYHAGNLSPVTTNTDQTISGEKTFSNLKVSNTNLVTNLNADRLDGLHASDFAKYSGSSEVDSVKYPSIGYGSSSNGAKCSGAIITAVRSSGDYGGQFNGDYNAHFLYYRGLNKGIWTNWKTIAFTEDVLPRTGGTLTGALTVNAPINNTGALKLLGASEVSSTGMAVHSGAKALGSHANALGYYTTTERQYQTVIGCYNEPDTSSLFVIGAGSNEQSRKNAFTVDSNGYVRMGNRLFIGVGSKNEVYFNSESADQLDVHTSAGVPLVIQGHTVRRGDSLTTAQLGTESEKWAYVYTEALKLGGARLTYDTGTLTIDKALKTTSTLTATQGEFANYVKIGNATISWNPKGYLVIDEGLASHKFISAGGVVTGDAGGGGGGLSLTDMWVSLNGNIDAYGKSKIHIDHIPLDVILSHDDYENDVANRINTFNYSNSSSFTSAVKALIVADNIPTLEMSKIEGLETTLTNIGTVVQNNYDNLNESISTLQNGTIADHEARIKAIERALTWQTV